MWLGTRRRKAKLGNTHPWNRYFNRKLVTHPQTLAEIEKQAILDTLTRWEGNRTRTAKELGITRKTLLTKLKQYGVESA